MLPTCLLLHPHLTLLILPHHLPLHLLPHHFQSLHHYSTLPSPPPVDPFATNCPPSTSKTIFAIRLYSLHPSQAWASSRSSNQVKLTLWLLLFLITVYHLHIWLSLLLSLTHVSLLVSHKHHVILVRVKLLRQSCSHWRLTIPGHSLIYLLERTPLAVSMCLNLSTIRMVLWRGSKPSW